MELAEALVRWAGAGGAAVILGAVLLGLAAEFGGAWEEWPYEIYLPLLARSE